MRFEKFKKLFSAIFDAMRCPDGQIGAKEASSDTDRIMQSELLNDIVLYCMGSCSRKGCYRNGRELLFEEGKLAIIFTKFMPPFTHTVRFVNYKKIDLQAMQQRKKIRVG